jgi:molybdenum cofactor biosynthesis enzyme MoaA
MDLKPLLRVDDFDAERLYGQLAKIWGQRKDQYSQLRSQQTSSTKKVEMSYIGG